jgi:hypothetical protein
MEFTQEEREKLDLFKTLFKVDKLTTEQIKAITGRDPPRRETAEAAATREERKNRIGPKDYSIKNLFKQPQYSRSKPNFQWRDIAKHAALKAQRLQAQKQDNIQRIAKLFRDNKNTYKIEKTYEYYYEKYKTKRSEWKVFGDIDIFQVRDVISELVNRMTEGLPDNVKLKVTVENRQNDRVNQTKLLSKQDIICRLSDWVNIFIDYYDMEIEDITFKLMTIEIPAGAGRVNKIITTESKRSIIQVRNYDTKCLARSIVVGLVVNNKEKLQSVFKGNLTEAELKEINKGRQNKTKINDGILSDNEKSYLMDGRKLQTILAEALHRIHKIPIKAVGNDFQDVKLFEEKLDIEVQIYNLESRQIYRGTEKPVKVHILMSGNHYDVISNMAGFECTNDPHEKAKLKCAACNAPTRCTPQRDGHTSASSLQSNGYKSMSSCDKCNKYFYGKTCYDNHIKNRKCIEHSYRCEKCHRFYKTRELKKANHKCDEVKCGNCKQYVNNDHECYMLKKDLKQASEKYIFYDFETKLDPTTKKHIVNYAVAQYFNGDERIFSNLDDFCKWTFDKSKHKIFTLTAHYGKGYDFQFVAAWLIAHSIKPDIHNGQKILQLEVKQD